jgi:hypothetical protein
VTSSPKAITSSRHRWSVEHLLQVRENTSLSGSVEADAVIYSRIRVGKLAAPTW